VHPIEWLRAVARSGAVPHDELAGEAASALAALGDDPAGLLLSARRLIDRHPTAGVLWWTCSRLLASPDVYAEVRALPTRKRSATGPCHSAWSTSRS
jgi:hypothetical protein